MVNPAFIALSAINPGLLPFAFIDTGGAVLGGRVLDKSFELRGWRAFLFNILLILGLFVFIAIAGVMLIASIVLCVFTARFWPWWGVTLVGLGCAAIILSFFWLYVYFMLEW